jgi:hypothetical protein
MPNMSSDDIAPAIARSADEHHDCRGVVAIGPIMTVPAEGAVHYALLILSKRSLWQRLSAY